eukprot:scaffold7133_cov66-Phaeocystis_antarctica.AAC.1
MTREPAALSPTATALSARPNPQPGRALCLGCVTASDRATRLHCILVAYAAPPRTVRAQPRFPEPPAPLTFHTPPVCAAN